MTRYIALLRGINISGKNKLPMSELKQAFAQLGYDDTVTYLNSGNVIFSCEEENETAIADRIRRMIRTVFDLDIPVFIIRQSELKHLLSLAPEWWGTDHKEIYDNLIFPIPPADAETICDKIGEPTRELERIMIAEYVIFWSFDRQNYAKANWWKKTASAGIGEMMTIRTANTLRKIADM